MPNPDEPIDSDTPKKHRLPVLVGSALMLTIGVGAFYVVYSGLILGTDHSTKAVDVGHVEDLPDIAFVPIEQLVVSLGNAPTGRYLHFTAQLEVAKAYEADTVLILPRVLDVLNGYLRAVELEELQDPTALVRLRAQMLRRVQMVTGEGRVRDLLVTEFVVN